MSEIDQLMGQLPLGEIASQLGVDEGQAQQSSRAALQALLGGLQANAADPAGALSLGEALGQHDPGLLGSGLADVDTEDGSRIVNNIFGEQTPAVISQLGGMQGAGGSGLVSKLLPMLAPIVLSYLAGKMRGGAGGGMGAGGAGGGMGDLLGGILGGGAGGAAPRGRAGWPEPGSDNPLGGGAGGGLGDLLGQVLGGGSGARGPADRGGRADTDGPSITDLLGGLLGGGKR